MYDDIRSQILDLKSISLDQAQHLWHHASDQELQELATLVKSRYHNTQEATWLIMAILNYTNICVAGCDYCSFYKYPHEKGGYLLTEEQLDTKIEEAVALGCQMVAFNGGFHPKLHMRDYAERFAHIHNKWPDLTFYEMTVAEFIFCCKVSKISWEEGAQILKDAGTQWVTGGGAEVLSPGFRKRHSPGKGRVDEYFAAQETLLKCGLGSTATMVIGFDETIEERFDHLQRLRAFQDRQDTKLPSFLCWTYKPWNNEFGGKEIETQEYLRWLAICRIYLDNIPNVRTSVLTRNEQALNGLYYGANDFDLPTEDEVTRKAGAVIHHQFDQILASAPQDFTLVRRAPWSHQPTPDREQSNCVDTQPDLGSTLSLSSEAHRATKSSSHSQRI